MLQLLRAALAAVTLVSAHGASDPPAWADEMLQAHNSLRSELHLRPMAWSDKLATMAQNWAETLIDRNQFVHSRKPGLGENLFEIDGFRFPPTDVVRQWASEARDYDYRSNQCHAVCGHYTQIVWRDTRQVGCGVARGGRREVWVCEYSPPGNLVGSRPY